MWLSETRPPVAADGQSPVGRRHVRIVPTRFGMGLLLVCVVLWILLVNYQLNIAYVLLFWLTVVMVLGVVGALRQLLGLRLAVERVGEYFAGQPVRLRLTAHSAYTRYVWCRLDDGTPETPQQWQHWVIPKNGGSLEWILPPQPRGRLRVPQWRCVSQSPFGLLLIQVAWQYAGDAVVYPDPVPHALPAVGGSGGEVGHTVAMSGDDIAYLLPHNPATPMRQVAWKQYAKSGQLQDKWFDTGRTAVAPDVISFKDYPPDSRLENLASWLCWRVLQAESARQDYVLELPHLRIEAATGQRERALTALGIWS